MTENCVILPTHERLNGIDYSLQTWTFNLLSLQPDGVIQLKVHSYFVFKVKCLLQWEPENCGIGRRP